MSELLQVSPKMLVVKERSLGVPMDMGLVLSMILRGRSQLANRTWQCSPSEEREHLAKGLLQPNPSCLPNPSQSHRLPRLQSEAFLPHLLLSTPMTRSPSSVDS